MFRPLHSLGLVAAFAAVGSIAFAQSAPPLTAAPPDFGTPPSGRVPILFNDHHVYAKPSREQSNRVISALIRGNEILVPLRSMFEQMGATVVYDNQSKTILVSSATSNIRLTVDQPAVAINGETRPLDVPPMLEDGVVLVPVRVIAETLGAYVQWEPSKRVVIIRYNSVYGQAAAPGVPATPPPPGETAAPSGPETPIPTPLLQYPSVPSHYEHFIAGDFIISPKVANELDPAIKGKASYDIRAATEFPIFHIPWMIGAEYQTFEYPHDDTIPSTLFGPGANPCGPLSPAAGNPGCVTQVGGYGQIAVPAFTARDTTIDAKLAIRVLKPRIFVGGSYLSDTNNYAGYSYPSLNGFGFGIEKLPDLDQDISPYASYWYYPSLAGNFTYPLSAPAPFTGVSTRLDEEYSDYRVGLIGHITPGIFIDLGYLADFSREKSLVPADSTHSGPYIGLGLHL